MKTQEQKDKMLATATKAIEAAEANRDKAQKKVDEAEKALERARDWRDRAAGAVDMADKHKAWVESMPVVPSEHGH